MSKLLILPLLLAGLSSPSIAAEQAPVPKWLLGIWELTDDPDRSPTDWMEYRADGTFVNTLLDCRKATGTFHLFRGDIYLAIEQNGKFLANGSRPNQEKTKLLYTSPRTRNTATYEKVASVKCHGG
jgi:hypothetical protein